MGMQRRMGTVEVKEHAATEDGGVDVVLEPVSPRLVRATVHFHMWPVARSLLPVGAQFDLILDPVKGF